MVWTTETLPQALAKVGKIHKQNFHGIRHKKADKAGCSYTYGYRIDTEWFLTGGAQNVLLPPEVKPSEAMSAVVGNFLYEVKSECLSVDLSDQAVAAFIYKGTQSSGVHWRT